MGRTLEIEGMPLRLFFSAVEETTRTNAAVSTFNLRFDGRFSPSRLTLQHQKSLSCNGDSWVKKSFCFFISKRAAGLNGISSLCRNVLLSFRSILCVCAATDCSRSFSQILVFNIHGRIGSGFLFAAAAGYRNRTRIIIGK